MKRRSLEEVITGLKICLQVSANDENCPTECPYVSSCDPTCHPIKDDALYYLEQNAEIVKEGDSIDLHEPATITFKREGVFKVDIRNGYINIQRLI